MVLGFCVAVVDGNYLFPVVRLNVLSCSLLTLMLQCIRNVLCHCAV